MNLNELHEQLIARLVAAADKAIGESYAELGSWLMRSVIRAWLGSAIWIATAYGVDALSPGKLPRPATAVILAGGLLSAFWGCWALARRSAASKAGPGV